MPGGDRTGPTGMGPMMGRRAGYCAGFHTPGYANPFPGRGFGMGRGRSRGFWRFGAEKEMLMNQIEILRSELELVRKRLDEMETG